MIWSGNIFLVLQEYDAETYDLGSFNSTYNRNGKSFRILKLREREIFFVLSVTPAPHNMVAVEQLKVASGTEELNVLFYFNDYV